MLSVIVAHGRNMVIGRDGKLPWHLPSDMRRFRELTTGRAVIMGRKTFESLPASARPLPDRRNIVLSTNPTYAPAGAEVYPSLEEALEACGRDCFVIGGSRLYSQALPLAERVYVTEVEAECDGDAFFPSFPTDRWRCVDQSDPVVENGQEFVFRVYEPAA